MKIWKRIVVYGLLAAVFLVGVCFPSVVGAVQDIQIGRMSDQVEAKTVQLKMSSNLTIVQKIEVVKEGESSAVKLESAQKMEYQEAYKAVTEGLEVLLSEFIPYTKAEFSEKEYSIELRMYEENSVILWRFVLEDENKNEIQVLLDDDTGLILAFQYLMDTSIPYSQEKMDAGDSVMYAGNAKTSEDNSAAYSGSVYDAVENYGISITDSVEMFVAYYADYLSVAMGGIVNMRKSMGSGWYSTWLYDFEGVGACEVYIVITESEFSINF